jgi:hypothetical protein
MGGFLMGINPEITGSLFWTKFGLKKGNPISKVGLPFKNSCNKWL